jgi:hypothetical protein
VSEFVSSPSAWNDAAVGGEEPTYSPYPNSPTKPRYDHPLEA